MNTYKISPVIFPSAASTSVIRNGATCIPFDPTNTDCAQFLSDWKAGATVTNADGSPAPYSDDTVCALGLETV